MNNRQKSIIDNIYYNIIKKWLPEWSEEELQQDLKTTNYTEKLEFIKLNQGK